MNLTLIIIITVMSVYFAALIYHLGAENMRQRWEDSDRKERERRWKELGPAKYEEELEAAWQRIKHKYE